MPQEILQELFNLSSKPSDVAISAISDAIDSAGVKVVAEEPRDANIYFYLRTKSGLARVVVRRITKKFELIIGDNHTQYNDIKSMVTALSQHRLR